MARRGARVVQVIHGQDGLRHVESGDFVISLRSFQGGIEFSPFPGKISPAYTILEPSKSVVSGFFRYLLKSSGFIQELRSTSNQLRDGQTLGLEHFAQVLVPVAPRDDQVAIADYLDRETAKIDALIAKQEQLIATLQEDRIATITHAVTRGLGDAPQQRMTETWLGRIPSHWSVVPFVRCTIDRVDYRGATPRKTDSGVQLVTARNVKRGWIDYEASLEYVDEAEYAHIMHRGTPELGDLLLTMEAPLGNVALVDRTNIALAQRIIKFRMDPDVARADFARYVLLSTWFQAQLVSRATGSTALGLKASKLPELKMTVPPIAEQKEIAEYLAERESSIDGLQCACDAAVSTLREYRSALITDAVTGKIDVREMV